MDFVTPRKRAVNLGAARSGTRHHRFMLVSALGLAVLTPLFLWVMGSVIGGTRAEVLATLRSPVPAVVVGLMLVGSLVHFRQGVQTLFEDYARGHARDLLVWAAAALSWTLLALGLWALIRIAL